MKLSPILKREDFKIVIVDLLMMALLTVNLSLIIFDWIFASSTVQNLLREHVPAFFDWYNENIHKDFLIIDLYFVAVYVIELTTRWIIAIRKETYHRWFFYPLVHWYDVLGSIPVGAFHFLRILRVISIMVRLQKLQVIDITQSYLYGRFRKYLDILMEEISDRVIVKILEMIQDEVRRGGPLADRIVAEIIKPQKEVLVDWVSRRIQKITTTAHKAYQEDIKAYLDKLIREAVEQNKEIKTIAQIPVFGGIISSNMENAISDIVYRVAHGAIEDLASPDNKVLISDLSDIAIETIFAGEEEDRLNELAKDILIQALELMKEQVKIQQWKLRDLEEREAKRRAKMKMAAKAE